jgi:hypothetical protein
VPDAFVAVDDHGLAADHAEHIAFRADHGVGSAADTVGIVNVRVLGLRAIGAEFALFSGFKRSLGPLLFLAQVIEEEGTDNYSCDQKGKYIIHFRISWRR